MNDAFLFLVSKLCIEQRGEMYFVLDRWVSRQEAEKLLAPTIAQIEREWALEAQQHVRRAEAARLAFEDEVATMLRHGAKDRKQAIRWIKQAS